MVTTAQPRKQVRRVRTYQPRPETSLADLWSTSFPIDVIWGIYARQSTYAQIGNESTEMQTDDLKEWLIKRQVREENICLFDADLGKSGTLRIDQRTDLQNLVARILADEIKAVLVYRISRLFRDESGVQYNTFAQICKDHHCIVATADGMFFNFNNPMHLKMFRYLAEQAAEYLPQQMKLLFEARVRKARRGIYVGFGMKPWGLIVDYNPLSPTYRRLVVYEPHAKVVLEILERFYALEADFYALCRELEQRPVLFEDFEVWVDKRNIPKKSRKKVSGGFHISNHGLKMLLTNLVYIGWLVVLGDIVSRDNLFRIVPVEKEYLFWYAFEHLSDFPPDGTQNEKRNREPRRFYHKYMHEVHALLHKKKIFSPQGKMFVHLTNHSWTYQIVPGDNLVIRDQFSEMDVIHIDGEISKVFLARLRETHDLDEYQHWLEEETQKVDHQTTVISKQLEQLAKLQDAILDERLDIQQRIAACRTPQEKEQAKKEAAPDLERLRAKSAGYDNLAAELKSQLPQQEETDELTKARKYLSFQTEVQKLIDAWDTKPLNVRAEFFNLFLVQAVFTVEAPHWIRLDLYWRHPVWQQDSLYIYRPHGARPRWTDVERVQVKAHYANAKREDLMQLLPTKTWRAIRTEALRMGIQRPGKIESTVSVILTWLDLEFMQREGITDLNTIPVVSSASPYFYSAR
jgi:Resolvase, N terminal domain